MPDAFPKEDSPPLKLQRELENVLLRYSHESDLTVYEALGAIDLVKINFIEKVKKDPSSWK